jgi:DinB superfamily
MNLPLCDDSPRPTPARAANHHLTPLSSIPDVTLHDDLVRLLAEIDAAEADARAIVSGLTDAQANWQPNGGHGWSIVQCLDHLAKINALYVGHFLPMVERAAADGTGPFRGLNLSWMGRMFVRSLEPPPKQRLKAPGSVQPTSSLRPAEALARYLASHDKYRDMVTLAGTIDVEGLGGSNPFFKAVRVRLATALMVPPAHDRRHLWQARQVLTAPCFPKG